MRRSVSSSVSTSSRRTSSSTTSVWRWISYHASSVYRTSIATTFLCGAVQGPGLPTLRRREAGTYRFLEHFIERGVSSRPQNGCSNVHQRPCSPEERKNFGSTFSRPRGGNEYEVDASLRSKSCISVPRVTLASSPGTPILPRGHYQPQNRKNGPKYTS